VRLNITGDCHHIGMIYMKQVAFAQSD